MTVHRNNQAKEKIQKAYALLGEAYNLTTDDNLEYDTDAMLGMMRIVMRHHDVPIGETVTVNEGYFTNIRMNKGKVPMVEDSGLPLTPIGKLVKAVRFVQSAHETSRMANGRKSVSISHETYSELIEALEGVEQRAVGINVK